MRQMQSGPTETATRVQSDAAPSELETTSSRPHVRGKFLYVGAEKFFVRGVTYGTFRPGSAGAEHHDPAVVEHDFAAMARNGVNTVRTYTVPPRWLLDAAQRHGLRVMVGLPWEQHITFLDDPQRVRLIRQRVRDGVRACSGHPAVLCYAIGNEIPSPVVRWHGPRRVEDFLRGLHQAARAEDPQALFTYVNYPSTEFLECPDLDLACFNVYLESQDRFAAYLARLHQRAGDRPLIMAEIGLDSRRNGLDGQAVSLSWQLRTAFAAGCAGVFLFAWTDEWHRGGHDIEDWDFGLTDRRRRPKPALAAVREAFADVPFPRGLRWPRISVVVCSCNGARTIRQCLEGLSRVEYPDFEVIVVNDGSNDATASIAAEFGYRLITTHNQGLSGARNTGLRAARGEVVAYLDDDAYPDPHWLTYLAATFLSTPHAAVGGPNIPPPEDPLVAQAVAGAPGGPCHVLLSDTVAEHIPGCNMAFRRRCLEAIGGFDAQFRAAGDDVDACWRIQQQEWTIGFSPAAVVWHHRRDSVRGYWKQQKGYGRAEALLERKWPGKYNGAGHYTWSGRIYGGTGPLFARGRIYQGTWGSAPFQSVYQPAPGALAWLPVLPEWYLAVLVLTGLAALGAVWRPLLAAAPLAAAALGLTAAHALVAAARAPAPPGLGSRGARLRYRGLTAALHLFQPLARLMGRLQAGLTPWRCRGGPGWRLPGRRRLARWSEDWRPPTQWVQSIEEAIRAAGLAVRRGADFDAWDLEVRSGALGGIRLLTAVEEHGAGRQLVRIRLWPRWPPAGLAALGACAGLSLAALVTGAAGLAAVLGALALVVGALMLRGGAAATAAVLGILQPAEPRT
jgi:GT2 family glycosyltransferase